MNIGILGSGHMGGAIGTLLARAGHSVVFASDKIDEHLQKTAAAAGPNARASDMRTAALHGEAVLISVWPDTLDEVLREIGEDALADKIVITCMSGLKPDPQQIGIATDRTESVAEELARKLPNAHIVETFNMTFAETLASPLPHFQSGERASLFLCGDDADAKRVVTELVQVCGYDGIDAGGLASARAQETLATAWYQFALASGLVSNLGFRALRN